LTFVSSAFVSIQSMPSWLQGFARHQPFTEVINALRILALGQKSCLSWPEPELGRWQSLAWIAGTIIVFVRWQRAPTGGVGRPVSRLFLVGPVRAVLGEVGTAERS